MIFIWKCFTYEVHCRFNPRHAHGPTSSAKTDISWLCQPTMSGKSGPALGGTEYRLMPSACRLIVRAKLWNSQFRHLVSRAPMRRRSIYVVPPDPSVHFYHWAAATSRCQSIVIVRLHMMCHLINKVAFVHAIKFETAIYISICSQAWRATH